MSARIPVGKTSEARKFLSSRCPAMMYKLLSATVLLVRTTLSESETPSGNSSFFKKAGVSFQSFTEVTQSFLWPTRAGNCADEMSTPS